MDVGAECGVCVKGAELKPTLKQNATEQEGMFIHLMLRASLCLVKIKTKRNNPTKVSKKNGKITTRDRQRAAEKMYKQTTITLM